MEAFLLLIVVVLLVVILSNINSKFKTTQDTVNKVLQKVEQLQKQLQNFEGKNSADSKQEFTSPKPKISTEVTESEIPKVALDFKEATSLPKYEKPKEPEVVTFQKREIPKPVFVPQKSWFETFKEKNPDLEKFVGENLINKIGILILVLGISFFVKYAIDKEWINEPARVGIGILAGGIVMAIAHKLKKNFAAFSSVLVAGAISIFYFTIAIAFHEYQLFSQTAAFLIMVVIMAFSTLVSVSYNRQELAVLSLIGGFAVPFMVSTGEGNYVVLFSYIAILNIGILGIAYYKKWRIVTILAFVFTSLLFSSWYLKELFDNNLPHFGALLFATLFYFIFSIIIVLNNMRNKGVFSVIEYFILVGNTFLFFGLGMGIIHNWGIDFKGLFTLLLAIYNLIFASILYKKFGLDKNAVYLLIGLTLTFVTLTIPIQFEGNQITLFWAVEAVLLFWLSQKSKINSFKLGAIIVQVLTSMSLALDWRKYANLEDSFSVILNPLFISGFFVTASLVACYFILKKEDSNSRIFGFTFSPSFYKSALLVAAIIIGYLTGILETIYQSNQFLSNHNSALAFPVTYHFLFVALFLFFTDNRKETFIKYSSLGVICVSILLYILSYYSLPNKEIITNFIQNSTNKHAFYLHYVILICLIYFGYHLYKMATYEPTIAFLKSKIIPWLFVFTIVYVLSNEIMVHSLHFSQEAINKTAFVKAFSKADPNDYYLSFEKEDYLNTQFDRVKTQIIKIGYPILWGIFSFVFLIIGIKQQWKNLRIIALTLLGLTIVKLFVYDINNVSETGKIIAFILLGVLILIISFVYQKIKKLVVDEQSKTQSDEE